MVPKMEINKLEMLRKHMQANGLDAYVVPSTDPHQSEYVPSQWQRRSFISGFTGSNGDLVVTENKAGLWTDSRYFVQAEEQLKGSGIKLFKMGLADTPSMLDWIRDELNTNKVVGIDPKVISNDSIKKMTEVFSKASIDIEYIEENLIDLVWKNKIIPKPSKIKVWPEEFAGENIESKLERLRKEMKKNNASSHVITMLDAIAWLFNIRGAGVEYTPVVISYAIVTEDTASLFVDSKTITNDLLTHLKGIVEICDYSDFENHLIKLKESKTSILLHGDSISQWVVEILTDASIIFSKNPISILKAKKNACEIEGFKNAHIRDGVAMVKFMHWLDKSVSKGNVTEISAQIKLAEFRSLGKRYMGPSFNTISAYKAHGAIVHYSPTKETDLSLQEEGLFLVDSGGQYLDGTTDITRTVSLGNPTKEQKDRFTRVLKGHINLVMTSFPKGTTGSQLDTIARKPLWDIGLNYGHGTGHGVGSYLGVHEGPHAISYYRGKSTPLEIGMVMSNEPGFYKTDEYGIRIENLIYVVKDEDKSSEDMTFLKFTNLTLCPIDRSLIDTSILDNNEITYLNDYHLNIKNKLSQFLGDDEKEWLIKACEVIK